MYTSIKSDRIYFHACLCPVGYLNPRHRLPVVAIIVVINIFFWNCSLTQALPLFCSRGSEPIKRLFYSKINTTEGTLCSLFVQATRHFEKK